MEQKEVFEQILASFQDSAIRQRSYYPDFRRQWESLLRTALESGEQYFDPEAPSVLAVAHSFAGIDACFHFDQLKIADWYRQDSSRRKRVVFKAQKLKHSKRGGLSFHDSPCDYDCRSCRPGCGLSTATNGWTAASTPS